METLANTTEIRNALITDERAKEWIIPNEILFEKSEEHRDMFLTTYRIRNSYEHLLDKLEEGEMVTDTKDMVLIQRLFDMDFYPVRRLSLTDFKNGRSTKVQILNAYKDKRWKGNRRRRFEITLELDNGKIYQINPNEILSKFLNIRRNFDSLISSSL